MPYKYNCSGAWFFIQIYLKKKNTLEQGLPYCVHNALKFLVLHLMKLTNSFTELFLQSAIERRLHKINGLDLKPLKTRKRKKWPDTAVSSALKEYSLLVCKRFKNETRVSMSW